MIPENYYLGTLEDKLIPSKEPEDYLISNISSFCYYVLKSRGYEGGIRPPVKYCENTIRYVNIMDSLAKRLPNPCDGKLQKLKSYVSRVTGSENYDTLKEIINEIEKPGIFQVNANFDYSNPYGIPEVKCFNWEFKYIFASSKEICHRGEFEIKRYIPAGILDPERVIDYDYLGKREIERIIIPQGIQERKEYRNKFLILNYDENSDKRTVTIYTKNEGIMSNKLEKEFKINTSDLHYYHFFEENAIDFMKYYFYSDILNPYINPYSDKCLGLELVEITRDLQKLKL
jgi:hypothetical protein